MVVAPAFDGDAYHLHQKVAVRARRVFGRKLHVVAERARQAHRLAAEVEGLGTAHLQLVLEVQVARRQKDMDARPLGELQRPCRHLDVLCLCPGQGRDARLPYCLRNGSDGRKVSLRGHRKAGLDNVHAQILQSMSHRQLLLRGHRAARRLLAIAQCGIEESQVIRNHEFASAGKIGSVQLFHCLLRGQYNAKL